MIAKTERMKCRNPQTNIFTSQSQPNFKSLIPFYVQASKKSSLLSRERKGLPTCHIEIHFALKFEEWENETSGMSPPISREILSNYY